VGGGGGRGFELQASEHSEMEKWGENLCIFHANVFLQLYETEHGKGKAVVAFLYLFHSSKPNRHSKALSGSKIAALPLSR
jgi:hypothetical protein